jgi:leucyl-tRNA synthetase
MKNDEVFICSERSALNMAYQALTKIDRVLEKICDIDGDDLIALPLSAPLSPFEVVYSLPMFGVSMTKGTGIVTSVPSDSPDDYATLRDLQQKKELRDKYKVTEEMVKFDPIPIIDIEGIGMLSA